MITSIPTKTNKTYDKAAVWCSALSCHWKAPGSNGVCLIREGGLPKRRGDTPGRLPAYKGWSSANGWCAAVVPSYDA